MSNKDMQKEERERADFLSFLQAVGWPAIEKDIQNRKPPEPDIVYFCEGKGAAFELLSITQSEFMKPVENAQVIYPEATTLRVNLEKKLNFDYVSQYPIELIIYWRNSMATNDLNLLDTQEVLWQFSQSRFQRIWYLGENDRLFLFHKNWWSETLDPLVLKFQGNDVS